jgi:hypothetical protein
MLFIIIIIIFPSLYKEHKMKHNLRKFVMFFYYYAFFIRREFKKVRAILEHFRFMISNTAEAWSVAGGHRATCCEFSSSPFVPSECGIKPIQWPGGLRRGPCSLVHGIADSNPA